MQVLLGFCECVLSGEELLYYGDDATVFEDYLIWDAV